MEKTILITLFVCKDNMLSYLIIKLIVKTQNKEPPRHREGSSSQINEFYNSPGTGKNESRNRYQIYIMQTGIY